LATNGQQEYQKRPFFGLNNKKIQIIKFAYLPIQKVTIPVFIDV